MTLAKRLVSSRFEVEVEVEIEVEIEVEVDFPSRTPPLRHLSRRKQSFNTIPTTSVNPNH